MTVSSGSTAPRMAAQHCSPKAGTGDARPGGRVARCGKGTAAPAHGSLTAAERRPGRCALVGLGHSHRTLTSPSEVGGGGVCPPSPLRCFLLRRCGGCCSPARAGGAGFLESPWVLASESVPVFRFREIGPRNLH